MFKFLKKKFMYPAVVVIATILCLAFLAGTIYSAYRFGARSALGHPAKHQMDTVYGHTDDAGRSTIHTFDGKEYFVTKNTEGKVMLFENWHYPQHDSKKSGESE